jgi:hypothetical protein
MSPISYEKLRNIIAEDLSPRIQEIHSTIGKIIENFKNLGLKTSVWYPEKIHTVNIGGIDADSYVGYSKTEGRWSLCIRIIEHDHEGHVFISQRVCNLESCGNVEIVTNAIKKVPELVRCINQVVNHQIGILSLPNDEIIKLRDPECEF